jgi:ankyrin repeat protein
MKFGCDPNYRPPITDAMANLDPWSPLIEAASNGRDAIVAALLAAKADPNLNLKGNASPLYFSACNGHLASTQMLFDAGARIDDGDRSNGRNGLWWAAKEGHTAVVKYLLGSDALVNYQLHEQAERAGTSALHMAAAHGRNECITVLVQGGADVALTEWKAGNTALHISAAEGHEEAVRRLLDGGADNTFTNNAGQRPSDVATAAGHERIATLIVKYHEAVEEIMTERGGTDGTSAQAASAHHLIQMNSSGGPSIVWRRVEWILRRGRLEENREGNRMGGMEC